MDISEDQIQRMGEMWQRVRIQAEGDPDWKRDQGEPLVEWALRTLKLGQKTRRKEEEDYHD